MAASISAEIIGTAARYDQQFQVPDLPVVRLGAAIVENEDGATLCGVPKPQILSGEFARTHLSELLDKCDGSRSHARLAEELSLSEDAVFKAVAFLWSCGAVEDQAAALPHGDVPEALATLLSRMGDCTGVARHWTEGLEGLRATRVAVAGDQRGAGVLADLLSASSCVVVDAPDDAGLMIFVDTPDSYPDVSEWGLRAWEGGIPFLRVALRKDFFQVGPYIDPDFTPCIDCALAGLPVPGDEPADAAATVMGLGIACHTVVALLSRCMVTHLPIDTRVMSTATFRALHAPAATRAACPTCGDAEGPMADVPGLAARYEQSVAIPPREFVDIKGHQAHYKPSNLKLQFEFRKYSGTDTVVLPEPRPELLDGSGAGLNLETLGLILNYAAGLRPQAEQGGKLRRWTAAGGNIGSVGARVVINDPDILPAGTYAYSESEHTLVRLGEAAPSLEAPVALILTANVGKVARKYGSFALRVSIQDGGCSAMTARRVSEALAIPWQPVARWDERALCAACHADPNLEPITTVTYLGESHAH
ncbi:hypothetical protein [Actinomyces ruminicola]|uniref:Bacteriocin biosynthesis cyclodehydratase domain-containing protein n=1 Tax=Actinomyces ruminicola TaxID=332524 RepID=A0A1G9YZM1_9ACTO|nr:hypothetical protein [Actinomyces ruminicola]SDN14377.1 hypothetical protein SAMN04487766_11514 [Actinomyces ruminicola]